jgi:WD40 repeat protein
VALSRQLALQSANEVGVDPKLALRLALSAVDKWPTTDAAAALRQATLAFREIVALPADSATAETAAFSPDGSRVVTGGDDGIVRVWDAATGHAISRLAASHGKVLAARYAPDNRRVALGFADGTLLLTNGSLGAPHEALRVPGASIDGVAFSRDGQRLAAALHDGTVRVLASDGSGPPQVLRGHAGPALGVDINGDGSEVVSAGQDGTVRVWDTSTGQGHTLYRARKRENAVRFSPDGTLILAVGSDGSMQLWNARTRGKVRHEAVSPRWLNGAAFSPDGRQYAVGGDDGVIHVWSVAGGPPVAVVRGQSARVLDIGFGPVDHVVSAGDDGTARIWDIGHTVSWAEPGQPVALQFSPDGRFIVTAGIDGVVRVQDAGDGRLRIGLPGPSGITTAAFSPTADELLIGRAVRSSLFTSPLSATSEKLVAKVPQGSGIVVARFDTTGRRIVYADYTHGAITVQDLQTGRSIRLDGGAKPVWDVSVAPDGQHVAAATANGKLYIWRLDRPWTPERVLAGHHGSINSVSYSPNGTIVTAGADRTARIWNPAKGTPIILRGHTDEVVGAAFTPNGARVLTASDDGTLRVWDANSGAQLAVLQSGGGPLWSLTVSPDGRIATLSSKGVIRVFTCEVCGSLDQVRAIARARRFH